MTTETPAMPPLPEADYEDDKSREAWSRETVEYIQAAAFASGFAQGFQRAKNGE